MNAGANGVETRERIVEVRALDRKGNVHTLCNADMGYAYRHSAAPAGFIFTSAVFEGFAEDKDAIKAAMDAGLFADRLHGLAMVLDGVHRRLDRLACPPDSPRRPPR